VSTGSLAYTGTNPPPALVGDNSSDTYNNEIKLTNTASSPTTADRISLTNIYGSGELYYSFTMKVTAIGSLSSASTGGFIAGFNNLTGASGSTITTAGGVLCIRQDGSTGKYQLGIAQNQSPTSERIFNTTDLTTTDTLFVVGTYTFDPVNGDSSNLYVFKDTDAISQTEPTTPFATSQGTTSTGLTNGEIESFFLRQNASAAGTTLIDDVRVGTTYADVVSGTSVPEPASLAVLALALPLLLKRPRLARASSSQII
jgi:hypothetical protein